MGKLLLALQLEHLVLQFLELLGDHALVKSGGGLVVKLDGGAARAGLGDYTLVTCVDCDLVDW